MSDIIGETNVDPSDLQRYQKQQSEFKAEQDKFNNLPLPKIETKPTSTSVNQPSNTGWAAKRGLK